MNIYLVSRTDQYSYDDYDAHVVISESEESAIDLTIKQFHRNTYSSWTTKENIQAKLLGVSELEEEICLSSFNAG